MKAAFKSIVILSSNKNDENIFRQLFLDYRDSLILHFSTVDINNIDGLCYKKDSDAIIYCAEVGKEKTDLINAGKLSAHFPLVVILEDENVAVEFIKEGADEILTRLNLLSIDLHKHIFYAIERKRKFNEQLNNKNHLINSIIDGATESIFVKDLNGKYLFVNDAVLKVVNKKREEIIGKDDLTLYTEDDAKRIMETDKPVIQEGKTISNYIHIKPSNGIDRIFDATKGPIKDEKGNTIGIFGISRDVTAKLEAERKLKESEAKLKLLFENSNDIVVLIDHDRVVQFVNSSVHYLLGWTIEEVLGSKITNIVHAVDKKEHEKYCIDVLATPDKKTSHIIRLRTKQGGHFYFDLKYSNCSQVEGLNGVIINASDVSDRIKIENNLKQNISVLHSTLESTSEGILVVSNEGLMTNYNSSFSKMWEIPEDILNSHDDKAAIEFVLTKLKYPEQFLEKVVSLYTKPEEVSFDIIELKDGRVFERYSQPQKEDDKCIGRVWSFRDISVKHNALEELLLKNNAIQNSISGIGLSDLNGNVIYANSSLVKMWGASSESDLIGMNLVDCFEGERVYQSIENLRTIGHDRGEDIGKRLDGTLFNVEFSANVVFDDKGNPTCMFGSFLDITERKRLEVSLKESETLFRELAENAPGGIVLLGPDNKYKYGSPSIKRMMGYDPEFVIGKDPEEHTHPDDLPFLLPKLNELIASPGNNFTAQYRFKHADGTWRWVESTFSNLYHVEYVNAMVINFQDITERIRSEEEISKLTRAVEQSSVSVVITDLKGDIEYVNPNFTKVTGYTFEEVKGKNTRILKSGNTAKEQYEDLWHTIASGNVWRNEISNKKKDGTIFWESVSISPVIDKHHKITHFIALKEDITERKKAEAELHEAYQKEKQLIEHLQNIREEERAKISREFHDEIGQHLTVLKMDVAWLFKKTENLNDAGLSDRLNGLKDLLDDTVKSFRRILSDLRPVLIDDIGLEAAMDAFIKDFQAKNGITTEFIVHLNDNAFPENINLTLYRILQESLNNINKHADAKNVFISIKELNNNVVLTVIDDGIGFDTTKSKSKSSFGIMGMEERIKMIGGEFEISSVLEEGTTLKSIYSNCIVICNDILIFKLSNLY